MTFHSTIFLLCANNDMHIEGGKTTPTTDQSGAYNREKDAHVFIRIQVHGRELTGLQQTRVALGQVRVKGLWLGYRFLSPSSLWLGASAELPLLLPGQSSVGLGFSIFCLPINFNHKRERESGQSLISNKALVQSKNRLRKKIICQMRPRI